MDPGATKTPNQYLLEKASQQLLRINQIIQLTETFHPKASHFQQKFNFLLLSFPRLSQCRGTATLCGIV